MKTFFITAFLLITSFCSFAMDEDCEADWDYDDDGLTVSFEDDSEADEGFITGYFWEFGDGSTSTEKDPEHTYATAGEFIVCLTIATNEGCSDTYCDDVDIEGGAGGDCEADFDWDDDELSVEFTDDSDKDGGEITSYLWDFGDGTTSSLADPEHNYAVEGEYIVCLTIFTDKGCSSTLCDEVEVEGEAPLPTCVAAFDIVNIIADPTGFIIELNNSSEGAVLYSWDFGDGTAAETSTEPGHFYEAPGVYTICLSVGEAGSDCFDVFCDEVTLTASNNTAINNLAQENFSIYPNPAHKIINLVFANQDEKKIMLYSIYGQLLYTADANKNISIPAGNFADGNYFIQIDTNSGSTIKPLVIQH